MAISPINNVSFRNNCNQVNFEGRNKEKSHHTNSVKNTLRSIPLATLIAMSPLNSVEAQTNPTVGEEKLIQMQTYKNPVVDGCNIWFISNDGNDSDIEAIALQHGRILNYSRTIRGVETNLEKRENFKQYLDTLKTLNVTYVFEDGSPSVTGKKYVVAGPRINDVYVSEAGTFKTLKHDTSKSEHAEYEIDKELYDYLLQFMEKNSVITEDREIKVSSIDVLEELFKRIM